MSVSVSVSVSVSGSEVLELRRDSVCLFARREMVDERAQTEAREEKEKEKVGLGPLSRGIYIVLSYLTIVLSYYHTAGLA